jgi:hypothetical protein
MSKKVTDGRGLFIKSVVNGDAETLLHVGEASNSFMQSLMETMPETDIWVAESEDNLDGTVELVGSIAEDNDYIYDIVAINASVEAFSTAMYVALESSLDEGGLMIVYGDKDEMLARQGLFIEMIREGVMTSFSNASIDRNMMIFVLSDGILVRSM